MSSAGPDPANPPVSAGQRLSSSVAATYLSQWMNSRVVPTCIVSADLMILWANAAADLMFEDSRVLYLDDGRLSARQGDSLDSLKSMIAEPVGHASVWALDTSSALDRIALVEPINLDSEDPLSILTFYPSQGAERYIWADLQVVFGLTPGQTEIVTMLFDGITAEEIAVIKGIPLQTTRTHLKRAYRRLSVTNREEMFAKIGPYRIG